MKLLAADVKDVVGTIKPIGPWSANDPMADLGNILSTGIRLIIIFAGFTALIYMLWGAFDWLTSSGEKEKLSKAQNKITSAAIGIILVIVALTAFGLISGDILGIITKDPVTGGWTFVLPTL